MADTPAMTTAQLLKLYKMSVQRSQFVEHLLRHVATVTYQYNCFEMSPEILRFAKAMNEADTFRANMKLKKSDVPRITTIKSLMDTLDMMEEAGMEEPITTIRSFLDMSGRLRVVSGQAVELIKILQKSGVDPEQLEQLVYFVNQWKGFCLKNFNYSTLHITNTEMFITSSPWINKLSTPPPSTRAPDQIDVIHEQPEITEEELLEIQLKAEQERLVVRKYLSWPAMVRTALYVACQTLRRASNAASVPTFPSDPTQFKKSMQLPVFVVAYNIDEFLFNRSTERRLSDAAGNSAPEPHIKLPKLPDIRPELLMCVRDTGIMFDLPGDPFVEPAKVKQTKNAKK